MATDQVLGDSEPNQTATVNCGNLATPVPSVIASPASIRYFAGQVAADGGFPFYMMRKHSTCTSRTQFNCY